MTLFTCQVTEHLQAAILHFHYPIGPEVAVRSCIVSLAYKVQCLLCLAAELTHTSRNCHTFDLCFYDDVRALSSTAVHPVLQDALLGALPQVPSLPRYDQQAATHVARLLLV